MAGGFLDKNVKANAAECRSPGLSNDLTLEFLYSILEVFCSFCAKLNVYKAELWNISKGGGLLEYNCDSTSSKKARARFYRMFFSYMSLIGDSHT